MCVCVCQRKRWREMGREGEREIRWLISCVVWCMNVSAEKMGGRGRRKGKNGDEWEETQYV